MRVNCRAVFVLTRALRDRFSFDCCLGPMLVELFCLFPAFLRKLRMADISLHFDTILDLTRQKPFLSC